MADNGFIKIHRKMLNWEWYKNKNTRIVFLHLLLTADYTPGERRGVTYDSGECVTSLYELATGCSLTIQQVRTALSNMKSTGEITERIVGKTRVITINNWSMYQAANRMNNRKITENQQDGQQENNSKITGSGAVYRVDPKNIDNIYNTNLLEERKKERRKEIKKYKYYPNDELLDRAFSDYVAMRKQIKKPMSDRAIELSIKRLEKLSGGDNEIAVKILEQSIMNSWQGLFELKGDSMQKKPQTHTQTQPTNIFEAWANA